MAINMWGANGTWTNKLGSAIGHYTNGQNVLTALPHPSSEPPTAAQLAQQARFGLVTAFLSYIGDLVKAGFQMETKKNQSPMNVAVSYNLKNAVTGVAPDVTIDYPKLAYSMGKVDVPTNAAVESAAGAHLVFTWTAAVLSGFGHEADKATILVYNPDKDRFVSLAAAALRSALTYNLQLPLDFAGDEVHTYMSFVSADGKGASKTVYVGEVTVL